METGQVVSREQILDLLIKSGYNPTKGLYGLYDTWEDMEHDFFTKNPLGQDGILQENHHHEWVVLISHVYIESVFPGLSEFHGSTESLKDWSEEATKLYDSAYLQYTQQLVDESYVNRYGEETNVVNNPDLIWIGQRLYEHYQGQK